MRNDIKRIDNVTKEMEVNNKLYYEMLKEFYDCLDDYYYFTDEDDMMDDFETLYFKRRVLSVMEKHDIPFRAAIGLFFHRNRLALLNMYKDEYIEDDGSDVEIFAFILELGYRFYDLISYLGDSEDKVYEMVKRYREMDEKEREMPDLCRCHS